MLTLPILLWLPGAALLRGLFGPHGPLRTDGPAWTFLAVAISVLLTGWLGFTLAQLGIFSPWLLALLEVLGAGVGLRMVAGRWVGLGPTVRIWLGDLGWTLADGLRIALGRSVRLRPDARNLRLETALLVGLLLLAAALFARPAEMVRGALDSGVYVNGGIALARSGALVQHDQLMRELSDLGPPPDYVPSEEANEFLQPQTLQRYSLDRLRMIGFYVLDKKTGQVLPQFYHLFFVWIGIGYGLFGIPGALLVTPLLALLAVAAVFFFARQMFTARVALVSLALLVLCPLQIWFARYPVSEIPTELLAFLFFYAFLRFSEETRRLGTLETAAQADDHPAGPTGDEWTATRRSAGLFAVLAAAALGEILLVRVDFPLYLLPLPFYLLWWRLSRTWRFEHTLFTAVFAAFAAQWALYFFFFSFAYTVDQYHNVILDQRRAWATRLPLIYLGVVVLFALDRRRDHWQPLVRATGAALARRRGWLLGALCAGVGAFLAYRYLWQPHILFSGETWAALRQGPVAFARWLEPYIGAPLPQVANTGKTNQPLATTSNSFVLVRLGWYLSPLGIALGTVGLLRGLWKRLNPATAYFFIVLGVVGLLFSGDTFTVPTYPYSLRRFLPVAIPGLLVLGAYALAWLGEKLRPRRLFQPAAWAVAAALIAFFVATGLLIISHTEDAGAVGQLTALAQRFPNPKKTVLLFSDGRDEPYIVATPLQYIFGFNVFSLNRDYGRLKGDVVQGAVMRWRRQGYTVYGLLGTNGGKLFMPDLALVPHSGAGGPEWIYSVSELEALTAQKPKNFSPSTLTWGLYDVVSRTQTLSPTLPLRVDIGGADYATLVAGWAGKERTLPTDPDTAQWRWAGHDALLRLPWPVAARQSGATLTLRLSAGPKERAVVLSKSATPAQQAASVTLPNGLRGLAAPAQVTVLVGDLPLRPLTQAIGAKAVPVSLLPGAGFTDVQFAVPPTAPTDPAGADYLLLHLSSPTWTPFAVGVSGDERALGVEVDSVELAAP